MTKLNTASLNVTKLNCLGPSMPEVYKTSLNLEHPNLAPFWGNSRWKFRAYLNNLSKGALTP